VLFTFINLTFEVVVFLHIYADRQTKHNESLVEQQMIKVLARATNHVEQFSGQRKGGTFKCGHFAKLCAGLHEIFGFHELNSHLLSFLSMSQSYFYFDKMFKYVLNVKICHEAKLQAFVKMKMKCIQSATFQNRRIFQELNNVTLEEML